MRDLGGLSRGIWAFVWAGALFFGGCGSDDGANLSQEGAGSLSPPITQGGISDSEGSASVSTLSVRPGGPSAYLSPAGRPIFYIRKHASEIIPNYDPTMTVTALNNKGHLGVVAYSYPHSSAFTRQAMIFDGTSMRNIGTLGGNYPWLDDLNDAGHAVGSDQTGDLNPDGMAIRFPFLFDGNQMRNLGLPEAYAEEINESGQVVGSQWTGQNQSRAFLYEGARVIYLGSLGGKRTGASAINNRGQIVGWSSIIDSDSVPPGGIVTTHAFLFERGILKDLGSLGPRCFISEDNSPLCIDTSTANDINGKGQIVGYTTTKDSDRMGYVAFLYEGGKMKTLARIHGYTFANSINESSQVTGHSNDGYPGEPFTAFLYDQGILYDLKDLILNGDGTAIYPRQINNFGQILGADSILEPQYDSVEPGREFSFTDTLRRTLSFEWWQKPGTKGCVDGRSVSRLEVLIEGRSLDTATRSKVRSFVDRWLPAGNIIRSCETTTWSTAKVNLPPVVDGKNGTIRIRLRDYGTAPGPIVYLRYFDLK